MNPFTPYIAGAALAAFVALGGGLYVQTQRLDASKAREASLARSVKALEAQAAQSAEARRVEAARAERFAARNAELSATVEAILTGDIPDENLDPRIADYINGLRSAD